MAGVLQPSAADRSEERAIAEQAFGTLPRGDLLLPYQQSSVSKMMSGVSLLVIEKSRRIGLTWAVAAFAVLTAAAQVSAGGDNCWYMGYDMEMAREFIETCGMWARAFGIAAEEADEEVLQGDEKEILAFRIRFSSGFKIVALPSVPRAIRGKQGKVLVDEAAFHKNIGETLKAALALLMWGGQVIVWSTHDGVDNPFNVLLDDIKSGRRKGDWLRIDFDQSITDGLYERIALMAEVKGRPILPKEEWIADIFETYGDAADEELRCIPSAGSGSLIKPEDLAACEHDDAGKPELYAGGLYGIGRDVARRRDGQIIWGAEMIGDVAWVRDMYDEVGQTFAHQDAYFNMLFRNRRVLRAKIDQTGKRAVVQQPIEVEAASDDSEDEADAQLLRDWLKRQTLQMELFDMLDAVGIRAAVDAAINSGETLAMFRDKLRPLLEEKGWWGRQRMIDPQSGQSKVVQLGSPRRLKTIYRINMRTAHSAGGWERVQRSKKLFPFVEFSSVMDGREREEHHDWNGTIVLVDDPWLETHWAPCGWGCRCRMKSRNQRMLDAKGLKVTTSPIAFPMRDYINPRTGEVVKVERGIDPGWSYNVGMAALDGNTPSLLGPDADVDAATRAPVDDLAPFFSAFGLKGSAAIAKGRVVKDAGGWPMTMSLGLFRDAGGRIAPPAPERAAKLGDVAAAIKSPTEIRWRWVKGSDGTPMLMRRYIGDDAVVDVGRSGWRYFARGETGFSLTRLRKGVIAWTAKN